jgi:hypothetical protein
MFGLGDRKYYCSGSCYQNRNGCIICDGPLNPRCRIMVCNDEYCSVECLRKAGEHNKPKPKRPENLIVYSETACVICMEDFTGDNKPVIYEPCSHAVCCSGCSSTYLKEHNTCPMCRHKVDDTINQ